MKVLEDRYSVKPFELKVICGFCSSTLLLNELDDFTTTFIDIGEVNGPSCKVKRMAFKCPLCCHITPLDSELESTLPVALIRAVKQT